MASSKSNSEVDLKSHYRDSIALQYPTYITRDTSAQIYDLLFTICSLPMNQSSVVYQDENYQPFKTIYTILELQILYYMIK